MFVVDTNVLIYGVNKDAPDHIRCRELLESLRAQTTTWYVTWGIVYEFLRVVTHPRVLARPYTSDQAWTFYSALPFGAGLGYSTRLCLIQERFQGE